MGALDRHCALSMVDLLVPTPCPLTRTGQLAMAFIVTTSAVALRIRDVRGVLLARPMLLGVPRFFFANPAPAVDRL